MSSLHRIADSKPVLPAELVQIRALIDVPQALHYGTREFLERNNLDPDLYLPANIWIEHIPETYFAWRDVHIKIARAISPFSGFDMLMWGRQDEASSINPADVDAFYARLFSGDLPYEEIDSLLDRDFGVAGRMTRSAAGLADAWTQLVSRIDARYRIQSPRTGGEMGIVHEGNLLNPDILSYQTRLNALLGAGVLDGLDQAIRKNGVAHFLEIGSGHGFFAHALAQCFGGKLRVHLIDLPHTLGNAIAYLGGAQGSAALGIVKSDTTEALQQPTVLLANYLIPMYLPHLPKFDLIHNSISLNEMSEKQVMFYLDFIRAQLAPEGVFHLCGGEKLLDYHINARERAEAFFRRAKTYKDWSVGGVAVSDPPHSFFRN